jgi:hypothetical protein
VEHRCLHGRTVHDERRDEASRGRHASRGGTPWPAG